MTKKDRRKAERSRAGTLFSISCREAPVAVSSTVCTHITTTIYQGDHQNLENANALLKSAILAGRFASLGHVLAWCLEAGCEGFPFCTLGFRTFLPEDI